MLAFPLPPDGEATRGAPADPTSGDAETTTDRDGRFRLGGIAVGRSYVVVAFAGDLAPVASGPVTPEPGAATVRVELVATSGSRVHGTVLDADGAPVAGARVRVASSFATTDAQGRFTLRALPPGGYDLVAGTRAATRWTCSAGARRRTRGPSRAARSTSTSRTWT